MESTLLRECCLCALRGAGAQACALELSMHPLAALTFSTRVAKRAQYERFDIRPATGGFQIRNESHANPADHEYLVEMDRAVPQACTCPADERFDGACKHRVAIAIRRPEGNQAQRSSGNRTRLRGDGGSSIDSDSEDTVSPNGTKRPTFDSDSEECEECLPEFPCWDCYRQGRQDFY